MRPLLLVMQAVGPYADRQIVDFRPQLDSGLFGIYGATGSGKSTIFSAMTFALFGEAARKEQHATTLRSDHADPDLLSQVELIFQVGDRTYRVVRQPEQTRPARRGGGETVEKHAARLFDVTGLVIDEIDESNTGKIIGIPKVGSVNDDIVRILGYGAPQFRQIVLLPQGRFEAFLSADTKERVEILRELFDVSLYRRLTERIKFQADAADKEITAARAACTASLSLAGFASMEQLSESIADAQLHHRDLKSAEADAKAAWDTATARYQAAAETDSFFKEHLDAEANLARIVAARDEIQNLETRLKAARVAASLTDAAAARANAQSAVDDAQSRLDRAQKNLKDCEANAAVARERLASLASKAGEIEKLKSTLHTFHDYEKQLASAAQLEAAKAKADRTAQDRGEAALRAKSDLESLVTRKETAAKAFDRARSSELQRAQLTTRLTQQQQAFDAATAVETATRKANDASAALESSRRAAKNANDKLAIASQQFATAEAALLQDHAAHLAAHLSPGDPCPVCGSAEHPAPARGTSGDARLDEAYNRAKTTLKAAQDAAIEAGAKFERAEQAASDAHTALSTLLPPERATADLASDLSHTKQLLARLGPEPNLAAMQSALENLDTLLKSAAEQLDAAMHEQADAEKEVASARRAFDDAIATVPADLRDLAALASAIDKLKSAIDTFARDHSSATTADRKAAEDHAAARRHVETATEELTRLTNERERQSAAFAARLAEHKLSEVDFIRHLSDVPQISAFETRIRDYDGQRTAAEIRLQLAAQRIAMLHRPDLVALATARDDAKAAFDAAQHAATTAAAQITQMAKLKDELTAEAQRLDSLEKATGPLRELAEAFTGRTYQKVDLETFAISTLFDRVLDAANLRLSPMTRGRYSLTRETEGRGNARRGLGIVVEDTYTGRPRPTSTLSGGETFIAALALALGLSDVVESSQGSVRLDTIFIDEGFGSLDSDGDAGTLETVLQTLQDLVGASRTVGLISHVPLVQQAIPNGFYVTKTPAGSHIEVRA